MKTENISPGCAYCAQTKTIHREKPEAGREIYMINRDMVDLPTGGSSPVASYLEALNKIKHMDYSRMIDAHKIFKSVTARFMEILQTAP